MPLSDGPVITSQDPVKALEDSKTIMLYLRDTLDADDNSAILHKVLKWLQDANCGGASSSNLTEANLEARDFRVQFAHEVLQSFENRRERSRSPK